MVGYSVNRLVGYSVYRLFGCAVYRFDCNSINHVLCGASAKNLKQNKTMSRLKKMKGEAKKQAYAAKKEQEGRNVINWIFGVLIALGAVYAIYTIAIS